MLLHLWGIYLATELMNPKNLFLKHASGSVLRKYCSRTLYRKFLKGPMTKILHFKTKMTIRDRKRYYIIISGATQQNDRTLENICIQHRSTRIYKAILDGYKERD